MHACVHLLSVVRLSTAAQGVGGARPCLKMRERTLQPQLAAMPQMMYAKAPRPAAAASQKRCTFGLALSVH